MFRVIDGGVFGKPKEETITVLGDRAQQTLQSRCPERSTAGRVPRGNHAARGSNCTEFLV
jgi:hypothetical protein